MVMIDLVVLFMEATGYLKAGGVGVFTTEVVLRRTPSRMVANRDSDKHGDTP
ncbi:hypothetical protein [Halopseudomonas formosensis]|jgi:hypothetical protein|uniref:hypothetical protein n=1 Tax=Halopseudomonas formosensis TaxID=1002526 RepID=UPI0015A54583|nr:hypothetical protein [Halopseudomonas formosensis]